MEKSIAKPIKNALWIGAEIQHGDYEDTSSFDDIEDSKRALWNQ